jgi:Cu(I)/Ag(I) efflux system membrane fusion protein
MIEKSIHRTTGLLASVLLAMWGFQATPVHAQHNHSGTLTAAPALNEADGKVVSIKNNEIVLSHGPIKSLGWPPMTMPFQLARPGMAAELKPGDPVRFCFRQIQGGYVIEQLSGPRGAP